LNENQRLRAANDPDFNFLAKDFSARVETWGEHTVSLNLERRKARQAADRQASLDRENERRAALGLPAFATYEELSEVEDPIVAADILLNQAALTVAEIAASQPTSVSSTLRSIDVENGV
jgi:hypothetical protein